MLRTVTSLLVVCLLTGLVAGTAAADVSAKGGGSHIQVIAQNGGTHRGGSSKGIQIDPKVLAELDIQRRLRRAGHDSIAELYAFHRKLPECTGVMWTVEDWCFKVPQYDDPENDTLRTEHVVETIRRAVLSLTVPEPTIHVGPAPEANEWNMAVVGYPLWLWTDTPATLDATTTQDGITIDISARRRGVRFAMGDGNHVDCRTMHAWKRTTKPATASPSCGYTYTWPSLPKGNYTITATSYWDITWSTLGVSGTATLQTSATRSLPVGELHALAVP